MTKTNTTEKFIVNGEVKKRTYDLNLTTNELIINIATDHLQYQLSQCEMDKLYGLLTNLRLDCYYSVLTIHEHVEDLEDEKIAQHLYSVYQYEQGEEFKNNNARFFKC